ncbi:FAD dependent oxidoreductase [Peniophora sp. CONT]|nr:FAD dependent oxidoreductase [Peniophora sp. CONT]
MSSRTAHRFAPLLALLLLAIRGSAFPVESDQTVFQSSPHSGSSLPVAGPTQSFWTHGTADANPLAAEGSEGALTSEADVCIIGSGIAGTSVAYHLSNIVKAAGVDVSTPVSAVILEARDFCSGATGRNGGHLTPNSFVEFNANLKLWGKDEAIRAVDLERHVFSEIGNLVNEHGWAKKVDFVPSGRVTMAYTQDDYDEIKLDYDSAVAAGVDVSADVWLTKEQMKERYGAAYPGALHPGSNVWPLKLVTQFYHLAKQASPAYNLTLHTRTPVTSFDVASQGSSRKWELKTPRGSVECSYVVHATNAYTTHLLPQFEIVPTRGQIAAVRANASAKELTNTALLLKNQYWFPRPVSDPSEAPLVIIGGGREEVGSPEEYYTTDDSVINPKLGKHLRDFLPNVFPERFVAGREPEMEWTGILGFTPTKDPYVGPIQDTESIKFDNQYIVAGFSGHGMPRAFGAAEVIARMVGAELDGSGEWEVPAWFPRHYLTTA